MKFKAYRKKAARYDGVLICRQRPTSLSRYRHSLLETDDGPLWRLAADFLADEGTTHLLYIDANIGFEPDQVFRLLGFDAGVSAAVYPIKHIDWQKIQACCG